MADETTQAMPQTGATETPQAGDNQATTPTPQAEPQDVKSLPAWAQTLISQTRAEAAANRKKANDYERERQQAEQARLAEQNRWEELAKQYKTDLDRLTAEKQQAERAARVAQAAAKHGLPADLAGRLIGETEEELDADAARLSKLIVPVAPNTEAGRAGNARPPGLTIDELVRRKRQAGDYSGV